MNPTLKANEITVGFHRDGYRIDKTAAPMDRYTQWKITDGKDWHRPQPVCFHSLPQDGWIVKDEFGRNQENRTAE